IVATAYSAPINPDGTLGAWRSEAALPDKDWLLASAASPTTLYYAGGQDGFTASNLLADVRYASLSGTSGHTVRAQGSPASPFADGVHTLGVGASDRVANAASVNLQVTIDATPPSVVLSAAGRVLSSGSVVAVASGTPVIEAAFADATSGVDPASLHLYVDGAEVTSQAALLGTTLAFTPTAPLAQGLHTISASGRDKAGNGVSSTAGVVVDTAPPTVALSSPTPGAFFGSTPVVVAAVMSDTLSGIDAGQITLSVDTQTLPAVISVPPSSEAWQTGAPLRTAVTSGGLAYLNGKLYSIGGGGASGAIAEVDVGTLSGAAPVSWTQTSSLPQPEAAPGIATIAGGLYVLGGFSSGGSGQATNVVYYARPDAS
ncbi:MAG: hypothetical protein KGL53_13590, partial [Elusimicrobia bacterium]|nr:hypothetical protein [Elusimicrobiota bacterium]